MKKLLFYLSAKTFLLTTLCGIFLLLSFSCKKKDKVKKEPARYTIAVTVTPKGAGTISPDSSGTYSKGDKHRFSRK